MTVGEFFNPLKDKISCGIVVIKDSKLVDYSEWSVNIEILNSKIKNIDTNKYGMIVLTI